MQGALAQLFPKIMQPHTFFCGVSDIRLTILMNVCEFTSGNVASGRAGTALYEDNAAAYIFAA